MIAEAAMLMNPGDMTFRNSRKLPLQRWYPYPEGYSPGFVETLIRRHATPGALIYDPFAGVGTTVFAAAAMGRNSVYSEANPFPRLVIETKLTVMELPSKERRDLARILFKAAERLASFSDPPDEGISLSYRRVFKKSEYFPPENFRKILVTRSFLDSMRSPLAKAALSVAVMASLIPSSNLKKHGDLRFKSKEEIARGAHTMMRDYANWLYRLKADYHSLMRKKEA